MKFNSWEFLLAEGCGFLAIGIYNLIIANYSPSILFILAGIVFFIASIRKYKKYNTDN